MQITLKQTDIEKSLKEYIATQGIRTEGKDVQIVFTAGRRGTGITAELTIEDSAEPTPLPSGLVVVANPQGVISGIKAEQVVDAENAESANDPEPEVAPVKTTSLFG